MPAHGGWEDDLPHERAQTSVEDETPSCTECRRPLAEGARWYSDGINELVPYCADCAEREFGSR